MGPYQAQVIWIRVNLTVMTMKGYSTSPTFQDWSLTIRCSIVSYTGHLWVGLTPMPRKSRRSLITQPSELKKEKITEIKRKIDAWIREKFRGVHKAIKYEIEKNLQD